jgi:hypothetical protein
VAGRQQANQATSYASRQAGKTQAGNNRHGHSAEPRLTVESKAQAKDLAPPPLTSVPVLNTDATSHTTHPHSCHPCRQGLHRTHCWSARLSQGLGTLSPPPPALKQTQDAHFTSTSTLPRHLKQAGRQGRLAGSKAGRQAGSKEPGNFMHTGRQAGRQASDPGRHTDTKCRAMTHC